MYSKLVCVYLYFLCQTICYSEETQSDFKQEPNLNQAVKNWADKLGGELWHFGEFVTRRNKVIETYKHGFGIIKEDGELLAKEIAENIKEMMNEKVEAVKRVMEVAEQRAVSQSDDVDDDYDFYDMKELNNELEKDEDDTDREDEPEDEEDVNRHEPAEAEGVTRDIAENISPANTPENLIVESFYKQSTESKLSRMISPNDADYPRDEVEQDTQDIEENLDEPEITDDEEEEDTKQETTATLKPRVDVRFMDLFPNPHFYNIPVNTNHSAVHVPSNVYALSKEVIKGIKWSEELNEVFRYNYKHDPTLSFQYFGSSTGFMRQYPAMKWPTGPLEVDLFDCRMRPWYGEAASSPKDMVILVDRSGSMTGMRREVARHVVTNILDTLGDNDFVNVYTFSNTTDPLVECFEGSLVQAHLGNVRVFKSALSEFRTEQIANFSLALSIAFELLQNYRESTEALGAQCNQAIMLVTDGVQYNFKEVFQKYNWNNLPFMPVRVFTYLIGREVSDVREVKWMACANQGYYVHLSTYAEVREQVLQYVPVMARPMVLNPGKKPLPSWSPVYADIDDPKLTDYLWAKRREQRQLNRFIMYRRNRTLPDDDPGGEKPSPEHYNFMISVSLPVYDKRQIATKVANLLGVAGTDIPIELITKLTLPHRLGVNGYAFLVTNNGYVLSHPDLRPTFQGILKPAYNRVDIIEVEIPNDDSEPREFNETLVAFRKAVLMQQSGKYEFRIKGHIDDMRRITKKKRTFFYKGITDTPFTLVVSLPDKYGFYRIQHGVESEPHRMRSNNNENFTNLFTGPFTVHPDWKYCTDNKQQFETPEKELKYFLNKMAMPGWNWSSCDPKLISKLVADAKFTKWFNENVSAANTDENGPIALLMAKVPRHTYKMFGITVAFLATHSGLTRWQDFINGAEHAPDHFHRTNNRAIDEVWYKRAVDQHYVNNLSFVYSVPAGVSVEDLDTVQVTASHAIFRDDGKHKAPAAVVGFQFSHNTLRELFMKTTRTGNLSLRTCDSKELDCLLVDDNGYILVSYEDNALTGKFFGDYRPDIMQMLVNEKIYMRTRMYDYQATCFPQIHSETASGNILTTPLLYISNLLSHIFATAILLVNTVLSNDIEPLPEQLPEIMADEAEEDLPPYKAEKELQSGLLINKTIPEPCDAEFYLYSLIKYTEKNISNSGYNGTIKNCERPFAIQPVEWSNLVFIMIMSDVCGVDTTVELPTPTPVEISYNDSFACYMNRPENILPRKHYMSCINRSVHEKEIVLCGHSSEMNQSPLLVLLSIFLLNMFLLL